MKILVITSCTKDKRDCPVAAAEMYIGAQHTLLMEGLERVWTIYGKQTVDLAIISAKYGLLNECCIIDPYNFTFKDLNPEEILKLSDKLKIHEQVKTLISKYDVVFFLLGEKYVRALRLPFEGINTVNQIFLLGDSYKGLILDSPNTHFVPAGEPLRSGLSTTQNALKGFVFKKVCERVCHDGLQVFEKIKHDPQLICAIARMTASEQK